MNIRFKLLFLFFLILGLSHIYSQKFEIGGEIRNRPELRNGFKKPLADSLDPQYAHNLRIKLYGSYTSSKFKAKVTLIDSKIFSADHSIRSKNYFGVYEAWGEYFFTPKYSISAGRQILNYDDGRLLTAGNWNNTPNAHDLVILKYGGSKLKAHLGGAWNNASSSLYNSIKSYESMFYGWGQYSFKNYEASAIWINEGFKKKEPDGKEKTAIYRNTVGGNLSLKNSSLPFTATFTGYYQFGYDLKDKKLDAFFLGLKGKYNFTDKSRLVAGGEFYSGTSNKASKNKDYTFNRLYGGHHALNGSMEYWITLPTEGLTDLYGGFEFDILPKLSCSAIYHTLSTVENMPGRNKKGIGSEIDLQIDYQLLPSLSIQGGWSAYFKNKGTAILKNQVGVDTRFPYWAYVMISYKPVWKFKKGEKTL